MMTQQPPYDMFILCEKEMEEALTAIEENLVTMEKAVYNIYLPNVKWVDIIIQNVNLIGQKVLNPANANEDLVQIEFIIEGDDFEGSADYS